MTSHVKCFCKVAGDEAVGGLKGSGVHRGVKTSLSGRLKACGTEWLSGYGEQRTGKQPASAEPLTGPGTGQAFRKADLPPVSAKFPM